MLTRRIVLAGVPHCKPLWANLRNYPKITGMIGWYLIRQMKAHCRYFGNAAMTDDEKRIVEWLESRVVSHSELAENANFERQEFSHSFTAAVLDSVANDIIRGDHRKD